MSLPAIRAALEGALAALSPALATAWENVPYAPVQGTPYQRVNLLTAEPANPEIGPRYTEQGYLQITLAYPLGNGPAAAAARATLIRDAFYRGRSITGSGITVSIERTPEIAPGRTEEDRYVVPVKIRFYSHISGA